MSWRLCFADILVWSFLLVGCASVAAVCLLSCIHGQVGMFACCLVVRWLSARYPCHAWLPYQTVANGSIYFRLLTAFLFSAQEEESDTATRNQEHLPCPGAFSQLEALGRFAALPPPLLLQMLARERGVWYWHCRCYSCSLLVFCEHVQLMPPQTMTCFANKTTTDFCKKVQETYLAKQKIKLNHQSASGAGGLKAVLVTARWTEEARSKHNSNKS